MQKWAQAAILDLDFYRRVLKMREPAVVDQAAHRPPHRPEHRNRFYNIIKRHTFGPKRNKGIRRRKIQMMSLSDVFEA